MCLAFHLTRIKELILEAMQSITAKHWPDCIDHVKGIKVNYWVSDIARNEMPEPVVETIMTLRQTQQARTRVKFDNSKYC